MALVYGQLESAQFENRTSDYSATVTGRIWYRTDTAVAKIANGSAVRQFLVNDGNIVIGNNGTANNNVRLHRGANSVLQFVLGGDSTAEGTLSASLAQLSGRLENYEDSGKPAFGNAGRTIWVTDLTKVQADTGSAWVDVSLGVRTALSVLGVTGNSNAVAGDIVAANDYEVLRRVGTAVAFGKTTQKHNTIAIASKTANYTTVDDDEIIYVNGTSGAFAITLHTPTYNQRLVIKRTDSTLANAIDITGTVDGATDWKLHTIGETYVLQYSTSLAAWSKIDHQTETPWTAYTPTIAGFGTVSLNSAFWKRDGQDMLVYGTFTTGTVAAAYATISLVASTTINSSFITSATTTAQSGPSVGRYTGASVANSRAVSDLVAAVNTSTTVVYFGNSTFSSSRLLPQFGNFILSNSEGVSYDFRVPISGWKA